MVLLKKKFDAPLEAEVQFPPSLPRTRDCSAQTIQSITHRNAVDPMSDEVWSSLDKQERIETFSRYCLEKFRLVVPITFLVYVARAIHRLTYSHRSNVFYSLAMGIGTMKDDKRESLFPVNRMPMWLLEFMANFFIADDSRAVK